jgi:nucleotide-binding universal stress UspA family protein
MKLTERVITTFPYKSIAVASAFSPRFLQVLAEAKRIQTRFGSELSLIYAGKRDDETDRRFADVLQQLALPSASRVIYAEGNPADAILHSLAENNIDMIVAGALEKEVVLHPFLGNVARRLVRDASCSVMLFTKPENEPKPLRRIVFIADYSEYARQALEKTFWLALAEGCEHLYVVRIFTTFDEIRAARESPADDADKNKTLDDEETALEEFVLSAGATAVPIEARCIRGNTGFAAADFVQSVEADLLVVPVSRQKSGGGEAIPSNIAWISDVIPCNLWVIR